MLLNYTFNLKWWNHNRVFKEITKPFTFKYFQTRGVLETTQTSKNGLLVDIINSLKQLNILTKCSILDVWLDCKNETKSFNKSFCEFNIFSFSSHLVKYFFSFYFANFYFLHYSKAIFKFCCARFWFLFKRIFM